MAVAAVTFSRREREVRLMLTVEGALVFEGSNVTKMVREVATRGLTKLHLSDTYSMLLPTDSDTLTEAAKQPLDEPLAVFILISA